MDYTSYLALLTGKDAINNIIIVETYCILISFSLKNLRDIPCNYCNYCYFCCSVLQFWNHYGADNIRKHIHSQAREAGT